MIRRSAVLTKAAQRSFSTESPKLTIARNLLMMQRIAEAKDEAALAKVTLPTVDAANLPAELSSLAGYFQLSSVAGTGTYNKDPNAWQNMGFWDFAATEAQRDETWPFLVGFV